MVVGILQFDVLIHAAESLKDKRRVVQSLKDRLHREHLCSLAEVGDPDVLNIARIGLAIVARDGRRAGEVLDAISLKLRALRDGEVGDVHRQILRDFREEGDASDNEAGPRPTHAPPAAQPRRDLKGASDHDSSLDELMMERAENVDLGSLIAEAEQAMRESIGAVDPQNLASRRQDAAARRTGEDRP